MHRRRRDGRSLPCVGPGAWPAGSAIAIDGRDADALAALATTRALRAIGTTDPADYEAALAAADRALAVDPGRVKAHVWKGYALGRTDEASALHARARAAGDRRALEHRVQ